jgi:hypothetical protein
MADAIKFMLDGLEAQPGETIWQAAKRGIAWRAHARCAGTDSWL